MLEAATQLLVGFIVALSGVLIPGPMLAFIIARTPSFGSRTGTLTAVGHIMVEFGLLLLIALGFGVLLGNRLIQAMLYVVGGVSLIALASITFLKLKETRGPPPGVVNYHPLWGGVLFSTVFNPTVILWWATIGTAMLMEAWSVASLAGVGFWVLGHFLADLSWYSFVSYSVNRGEKLLGTRSHRALLVACGSTLLVFGVYFIARFLSAVF